MRLEFDLSFRVEEGRTIHYISYRGSTDLLLSTVDRVLLLGRKRKRKKRQEEGGRDGGEGGGERTRRRKKEWRDPGEAQPLNPFYSVLFRRTTLTDVQ